MFAAGNMMSSWVTPKAELPPVPNGKTFRKILSARCALWEKISFLRNKKNAVCYHTALLFAKKPLFLVNKLTYAGWEDIMV